MAGLHGAHAGGVGGLHDHIGPIGDLGIGGLSPLGRIRKGLGHHSQHSDIGVDRLDALREGGRVRQLAGNRHATPGTDRSECHNLAAQEPVKLRELQDKWFVEAGKYFGLPLEDRGAIAVLTTHGRR